jgi:hypothetical protein
VAHAGENTLTTYKKYTTNMNKVFKYILKLVENDIEQREKQSKENYRFYLTLKSKAETLERENNRLKSELNELSKEHLEIINKLKKYEN